MVKVSVSDHAKSLAGMIWETSKEAYSDGVHACKNPGKLQAITLTQASGHSQAKVDDPDMKSKDFQLPLTRMVPKELFNLLNFFY